MNQTIRIEVEIEAREADTTARAMLNHRGHDFSAAGRARRNPADRPLAVIGEELAVARALGDLSRQLMESAQAKIDRFLGRPPVRTTAECHNNNHSRSRPGCR